MLGATLLQTPKQVSLLGLVHLAIISRSPIQAFQVPLRPICCDALLQSSLAQLGHTLALLSALRLDEVRQAVPSGLLSRGMSSAPMYFQHHQRDADCHGQHRTNADYADCLDCLMCSWAPCLWGVWTSNTAGSIASLQST